MTDHTLPHDPYIDAILRALDTAGLDPDDAWTSDAEVNRYDAGCTTMLDAHLVWTMHTGGHPHGIHLVWEHPAEQWQWAPRRADGVLAHDPEFLPVLPRWAHPVGVVEVVRELLAGRPLPEGERIRWHRHAEMQDAVDAWEAEES